MRHTHDDLCLPGVGDVIMDTNTSCVSMTTIVYHCMFRAYECKSQPYTQKCLSFLSIYCSASGSHPDVLAVVVWCDHAGLWGFTCVVVQDSSPWFSAGVQVTSQQAWLPALTPGNTKINETIKLGQRHQSAAQRPYATASHYVSFSIRFSMHG